MPPNERAEKQAAAQQAVDILHEIATILVRRPQHPHPPSLRAGMGLTEQQNCHLDRRTLSICISMIENGVSPEALAVSFYLI